MTNTPRTRSVFEQGNGPNIDMITTGPVGKPIGDGSLSGMRVFIVRDSGLTHRFYSLGELPNAVDLTDGKRPAVR